MTNPEEEEKLGNGVSLQAGKLFSMWYKGKHAAIVAIAIMLTGCVMIIVYKGVDRIAEKLGGHYEALSNEHLAFNGSMRILARELRLNNYLISLPPDKRPLITPPEDILDRVISTEQFIKNQQDVERKLPSAK